MSSPMDASFLCKFIPKIVKLDFPRYDRKQDPTIWICKANKYFRLYEIAKLEKVMLGSFYLEGDA